MNHRLPDIFRSSQKTHSTLPSKELRSSVAISIRFIVGGWFLLSVFSCEKAITFNLDKSPSQLVVDASIESGRPPFVVLSTSLDYFSTINPQILEQSFVHGAQVVLQTGSQQDTLKEYSSVPDSVGNKVFYYTSDSVKLPLGILGSFGTHYTLTIKVDGKTYQATTTIPLLVKKIDSLWWLPAPNNPDTTLAVIKARITDPPGLGNYIRYFTSTNYQPFFPPPNSAFDDQIVDGTTYDIELPPGQNRNAPVDKNKGGFFSRGDTVTVKFCDIDKATYDFWRTMEYNYQSVGNPFSSPTQVQGNISNNALGYFGGYAAQFKTVLIPK